MFCCDKCKEKQPAKYRIGWAKAANAIHIYDTIMLCEKCYKEFMAAFGKFKETRPGV